MRRAPGVSGGGGGTTCRQESRVPQPYAFGGLGNPVTATQGENLPGPSPIRVNEGDPVAAGPW